MQWTAELEDFEVREDGLDISSYSVKPGLFLGKFIGASACDSHFHVLGSLQSFCVCNLCQS